MIKSMSQTRNWKSLYQHRNQTVFQLVNRGGSRILQQGAAGGGGEGGRGGGQLT